MQKMNKKKKEHMRWSILQKKGKSAGHRLRIGYKNLQAYFQITFLCTNNE